MQKIAAKQIYRFDRHHTYAYLEEVTSTYLRTDQAKLV